MSRRVLPAVASMPWIVTAFFMALFASALTTAQETGEGTAGVKDRPAIRALLRDLSDSERAEAAVEALVARADEAKGPLMGEALEGNDLARRGWAIVALAEIGGSDVDAHLERVHNDQNQPSLIRTWAAAGRVYLTDSTIRLITKASLANQFPAIGRPVAMRIVESLAEKNGSSSAEDLLTVSLQVPQLQQALAPAILALGPSKLINVMTTASQQNIRYQAAAYLGTLSNQGDETVATEVAKAYAMDSSAQHVPWNGGPLYVPGIKWTKSDAQKLVGNLIAWHLWCDLKGKQNEQQQINNNLNSISLASAAGYGFGGNNTVSWLKNWGQVVGRQEIERILTEQGAEKNPKYAAVLEQL